MSYLNRLKAEAEKRGEGVPAKPAKAPFAPFAGSTTGHFDGLPDNIVVGLTRLPSLPTPRLTLPVWPEIVADALRLAREGWAAKALALGWLPHQLFGAHLDTPGLAVWLCGRRIHLIDGRTCTVADGPGRWAIFTAREPGEGCVFLWEYGRNGRGRGRG